MTKFYLLIQSVFKILYETFILKLEKLNDCYDYIPPFSCSSKEGQRVSMIPSHHRLHTFPLLAIGFSPK